MKNPIIKEAISYGCGMLTIYINNNPEINEKLSYEDYKKLDKSFRVFRFEEAKKYIDFKSNENKFISEIQG